MIKAKLLKKSLITTNVIQLKLIKETQIFFIKYKIFIKGPRGIVLYSSFKNGSKYNLTLDKHSLTICKNFFINEKNIRLIKSDNVKLINLIQTLITGVHFFFSKKLLLIGIGLHAWVKTLKNNQKVLLIKVGFSEDLCIKIPKSFLIFSLRQNVLLIRGLNKERINQFASFVRVQKKPECYKGIGIQYNEEVFTFKTGKKN